MTTLLLAVIIGIALLLFLILYFRIPAFISLLIASILTAIMGGMPPNEIMETVQNGMGSTLGFVATVVGLGAMFGAILEHSGGATAIANNLIKKMGVGRAPLAMTISGFIVAIPVFFDVAFIILVPVIYALQRKTKKSLLLYALPLLAGLAVTHTFIPPTPGPVAVADILGVDLGTLILLGFIAGIPTAAVAGLWFGVYKGKNMFIEAPPELEEEEKKIILPPVSLIFLLIAIPIVLILLNTGIKSGLLAIGNNQLSNIFQLIGHPFSALIIANLLAWYFLGLQRGMTKDQLFDITTKSMAPAGTIILLTGAGGVFKQVLVDTGAGEMLATSMTGAGIPIILFAFLVAALIRILQGSATVAMITGAGLVAPLLENAGMSSFQLGVIAIAIASGATIFSHVNDSGFWLVGQYLGLSEKQNFSAFSSMTTVLALTGFLMAVILWVIF